MSDLLAIDLAPPKLDVRERIEAETLSYLKIFGLKGSMQVP